MTDQVPSHQGYLGRILRVARGRLGRQTLVTLFIRVGALGLALLVAIVLARMLGTEGYGAYSLAFAWVQILLIPGLLGMDSLMVRETARLQESQPERSRSYALWSTKAVLLTSLATAIVVGGLIVALHASQRPEVVLAQTVALVLLPMMAVTGTWQAILRAIDRMYIGQVPESIVVPVLILAGAAAVGASSIDLTPAEAIGLRIAGISVAVLILGWVLFRALPAGSVERLAREESRSLLRSSFALGLIGAVFLLVTRTDVVMLGILSDLESVGSYT
ncbi:MAG: oligosaccharide flippase family protein, partial [Acidimicrobiia bacterium]|nr:oligosaccharide flippase family protein [Acidimicrobiia bacterium]